MTVLPIGRNFYQRPARAAVGAQIRGHRRFAHGLRLIVKTKSCLPLRAQIFLFQIRHDLHEPRFFVIACPAGGQHLAGAMITLHSQTDLLEIIKACRAPPSFASCLDRRQEQRDENAKDGDDDEQLDQGEAASRLPWTTSPRRITSVPQHRPVPPKTSQPRQYRQRRCLFSLFRECLDGTMVLGLR